MEYFLLVIWFYVMIHSAIKIYKAQSALNEEIKKGNMNVYLKKYAEKSKSFS